MNRYIFFILILVVIIILPGCFRLDSFLFVPHDTEEYLLDNAEDEQEIREEVSFINVPEALIHQFHVPSENGNEIYGILIGDTNSLQSDQVILYCHGNTGNMDNYWPRAKLLWHAMKINGIEGSVLLFDYQGFGASEGEPTESALYQDTRTMWDWLRSRGVKDENIILYGYSLGSAPATKLADYQSHGLGTGISYIADKLILEAPFASAEVFAQDATELAMSGSFVVNLEINNAEEIKEVTQPFLWIHGMADDYIPMETHGQVVFDNYSGKGAQAVKVPNANHSNVPAVYGIEKYIDLIGSFIK